MATFANTSPGERLGKNGVFRVTLVPSLVAQASDSLWRLHARLTHERVAGTALAYPLHQVAIAPDTKALVMDLHTGTGAEGRAVGDLAEAIDNLDDFTNVAKIERIRSQDSTARTANETREREQMTAAAKREKEGLGAIPDAARAAGAKIERTIALLIVLVLLVLAAVSFGPALIRRARA